MNNQISKENGCIDFSDALRAVKQGIKIRRLGWEGKNMFVVYQKGYPEGIPCNKQTADALELNEGDLFICNPYLQIQNSNGSHSMWVPSVDDILADDWVIVDSNNDIELRFRCKYDTPLVTPLINQLMLLYKNFMHEYDHIDDGLYSSKSGNDIINHDWKKISEKVNIFTHRQGFLESLDCLAKGDKVSRIDWFWNDEPCFIIASNSNLSLRRIYEEMLHRGDYLASTDYLLKINENNLKGEPFAPSIMDICAKDWFIV